MIFKDALKVLIFLCLGLLISRYNASSPERGLHNERHKENKPSEDIIDAPLKTPMTCLELFCREIISRSQLLEKNVKGENNFDDKLSERFRGKRSAEEFSEDKSFIKQLYEIESVMQDNFLLEKILEELSTDKTSEELYDRITAHFSHAIKAKDFEQYTVDTTCEGVFLGKTTEDLSKDESSENLSAGLKSEERSAGRESEERSVGRKSEERSAGQKSEERSAGRESEERSADRKSEERSSDRKSKERSAGRKSEERSAGPMSDVFERNIFESETVNDVNKCNEIVPGLIIALVVLCLIDWGLAMRIIYIRLTLREHLNHEANENTLQNLELSILGSQLTPPPPYFPPTYSTSVGTPPVDTPSVGTPSPPSQTQISVPQGSETLQLNRIQALRRRCSSWWPFQRRLPLRASELTQTSGTSRSSRPSFNPSDRPPPALQNQEAVAEGRRSSQGYQTSRMDFNIPHSLSNMSSISDRSGPPSYSSLSPAHESSNVLEPGPSRQVPITEREFPLQQLPDDSSSD